MTPAQNSQNTQNRTNQGHAVTAIYNEIEPYACDWLENLIAAGHIAPGTVDRRSIKEIEPDDVRHARQFHAFAGIGVWSYALRLAGWPTDRPVWTGSCPCQPFSLAGKQIGKEDDRHLWPSWFRLVKECRPPFVFGEQVGSEPGLDWFGAVSADLEGEGYAVAGADLPAAGVGASHRRQRLWFFAMADADGSRCRKPSRAEPVEAQLLPAERSGGHLVRSLAFPPGPFDFAGWSRDIIRGRSQPGILRGIDGPSARVGRLRAYGNAIVPQVAAAFIRSALEAIEELKP